MSDFDIEPYKFPDSQPSRPQTPGPVPAPGPGPAPHPLPPPERGIVDPPRPQPQPQPSQPETPFAAPPPKRKKGRRGGSGGGGGGNGRAGRFARGALTALAVVFLIFVLAGIGGAIWIQKTYLQDIPVLPARDALYAVNRAPAIRFFDRNGALIASRGPRYGDRVTLDTLPAYVPQAFLAAEDRRFYQHGAVDVWGIGRAFYANWRAGRVVEGGSTLSQQLAKGLFLTPEQTMRRKIQEAVMATRLEGMLTKDEVLELYLNRIYFGANTYGLDGAARTYFGKPAGQLTLGEAALLAALPKAPSRLALNRDLPAALDRSHLVLDRMRRERWITDAQLAAAMAEVPRLAPTAQPNDGPFGWALDYATTEAIRLAGRGSPDLLVRLSIDPKLQTTAALVVRRVIDEEGRSAGATQGALVALGADGSIRAMVGGADYTESVFNRAVQARRQPGSSFKPYVYAAALEKGILPTDVRNDAPIKFGDWAPQNYGGGYRGPVTVETALARSINTVAVRLGKEVGPPAIASLSRRFGLTTIPPDPNLSIALGAYEVNMLEHVSGFQVFQQGGNRIQPFIIEEMRTVAGQVVYSHVRSGPVPAYDIARASMMVKMMKKVITQGTGTRAGFGWPAAGKTGTTQDWRDAWFVGFTPEFVAGVWIGNDENKPMDHVAGGELPAQIWRRFMIVAHEGLAVRDFDWLLPDPVPEVAPDPRNGFYETLASEFSKAASDASTVRVFPEDAPKEKPVEETEIPY